MTTVYKPISTEIIDGLYNHNVLNLETKTDGTILGLQFAIAEKAYDKAHFWHRRNRKLKLIAEIDRWRTEFPDKPKPAPRYDDIYFDGIVQLWNECDDE
jgi:hypothetical protein